MGRRRSGSSVTHLLSDITDNVKDFVDDEVLDRGRGTERDLRRAGRNWTDSDSDRDATAKRSAEQSTSRRGDEVGELREAIRALSKKIDALAETKKEP